MLEFHLCDDVFRYFPASEEGVNSPESLYLAKPIGPDLSRATVLDLSGSN